MTSSQAADHVATDLPPARRTRTTMAAFVLGVPLATAILCSIHFGPYSTSTPARYVKHPAEQVEVLMFCMALGALTAKLLSCVRERRACGLDILPRWRGASAPVSEAGKLLAGLQQLPRRLQNTLIVRRAVGALDFVCQRRSAADLDDQLRAQADTDAMALEGSYGLIRFITWAVPILGFLGTVLGITAAIAGVSPEKLEHDINAVTDGLAEAFDTTALALALTMLTMFLSFIVERFEQGIHDAVDRFAERELANRFERAGGEEGRYVEALRRNAEVLLQAMDGLVQRQTKLWAQSFEQVDRRRAEGEERRQALLTDGLEKAMAKTLAAHSQQLQAQGKQTAQECSLLVEKLTALAAAVHSAGKEQQAGLAEVAHGIAGQLQALAQLQEEEKHLRRQQELLTQNLAALAGVGTFEEALHSLTAAIHLLTARNPTPAAGTAGRVVPRPGAAA
jgi:biopolymer transport protein ExbB/TolQ